MSKKQEKVKMTVEKNVDDAVIVEEKSQEVKEPVVPLEDSLKEAVEKYNKITAFCVLGENDKKVPTVTSSFPAYVTDFILAMYTGFLTNEEISIFRIMSKTVQDRMKKTEEEYHTKVKERLAADAAKINKNNKKNEKKEG